jgi:hypothetical protein
MRTTDLNVDRRAGGSRRNLYELQAGNWCVHKILVFGLLERSFRVSLYLQTMRMRYSVSRLS